MSRRGKVVEDNLGLCGQCEMAHIVKFKGSVKVFCKTFADTMVVLQPVEKCNEFQQKNTLNKYDMEKIAWTIKTDSKGLAVGFSPPTKKGEGDY